MAAEPPDQGHPKPPELGPARPVKVAVVGPCVSGKSTIAAALRARGLDAYSVAQEHSIVPDLWSHRRPDLLVYLDVSYEEAARRRVIFWGPERHERQKELLTPTRERADMVVMTDGLSVEGVVRLVLQHVRGAERR